MKLYFIMIDDGTDSFYEYHSSIAKAKKSRTRWNRELKTELVFGSGPGDLSDVYENPDYKSVYDQEYAQNMTNVALDTLNFTTGNSFGLAPGDTTLTITYRVAGGIKSNVGSGNINKVNNLINIAKLQDWLCPYLCQYE